MDDLKGRSILDPREQEDATKLVWILHELRHYAPQMNTRNLRLIHEQLSGLERQIGAELDLRKRRD